MRTRRHRMLASALGLTFAGLASTTDASVPACTPGAGGSEVVAGEYIVNIVPTRDDHVLMQLSLALFSTTGDDNAFEIDGPGGMILLRTPAVGAVPGDKMLQDAILGISVVAIVRSEQPNFRWRAPPDPDLPPSTGSPDWALDRIRAPVARMRSQTDAQIVVAVVDSGIDRLHDDFRDMSGFAPKLWTNPDEVANGMDDDDNGIRDDLYGASFHTGDPGNDIDDENGHGTLVASIIGGRPSQSGRPGGVATQLRLMPVRVLGAHNTGSSWSVAQGIQYAIDEGAHIVNLSLQSECDEDDAVRQAVRRARQAGRILVVAAGNDSGNGRNIDGTPSYPAAFADANLLVVGGTNADDYKVSSSRYGIRSVDIGAPGSNMHGARPDNHSGRANGTSFAAPLASGGLALLAPLTPDWSWEERAGYLVASVRKTDTGLGTRFASGGILDLDSATQAPVVVAAPVATDTWKQGEMHRITWTPRFDHGACRSLDVAYSPYGHEAFPFTFARDVPVVDGGISVAVPTLPAQLPPDAGKGALRLTCSGTLLHAFSEEFKLE